LTSLDAPVTPMLLIIKATPGGGDEESTRGCDGVDTNIIEEDTIETSVVMAPYYDNIIIISDHDTY
jgi:hypothetical protein